jgi:hypothetical protein
MIYAFQSLNDARGRKRKRINYDQVKFAMDVVKGLMSKESDPFVKKDLVKAGMTLNKILLR